MGDLGIGRTGVEGGLMPDFEGDLINGKRFESGGWLSSITGVGISTNCGSTGSSSS